MLKAAIPRSKKPGFSTLLNSLSSPRARGFQQWLGAATGATEHVEVPPRAVFSGQTAAWLHGLDTPPCSPIEVTLPRLARTSRLAGLALTRSDLSDGETAEVHGLRATAPVRTIADLARRLPFVEAVVVVDMALHRRTVRITELMDWARTHPGYHGLRQLRRVLQLAEAATESPMETRLRLLLIADGLPRPNAQVSHCDAAGMFIGRVDLYYPDQRLAIEYDGATHRSSLAADNRRQNRLFEAGYGLLRFTAADVIRTPASVAGQVRRAFRRYSSSSTE